MLFRSQASQQAHQLVSQLQQVQANKQAQVLVSQHRQVHQRQDRKSVVEGKSVALCVDLGGGRFI